MSSDHDRGAFADFYEPSCLPEAIVDSLQDRALEFVFGATNGMFTNLQKREVARLCAEFAGEQSQPVETGDAGYLAAIERFRFFLCCMDSLVNGSADLRLAWTQIAACFGLQSAAGMNHGLLALRCGVSAAVFSKGCQEFSRMTGIPNAGGKSHETIRKLQTCARRRPGEPASSGEKKVTPAGF